MISKKKKISHNEIQSIVYVIWIPRFWKFEWKKTGNESDKPKNYINFQNVYSSFGFVRLILHTHEQYYVIFELSLKVFRIRAVMDILWNWFSSFVRSFFPQQLFTNEIFDDINSGISFYHSAVVSQSCLACSSALRWWRSYHYSPVGNNTLSPGNDKSLRFLCVFLHQQQPWADRHSTMENMNGVRITMLLCFLSLIVFSVNCHQELESKLKILM